MVSPAFREIMSELAPLSQLAMATLIPAVLPYGSILAAILNQAYKDGRRQTPTMTSAAARLRDSRFKSRKKIRNTVFIHFLLLCFMLHHSGQKNLLASRCKEVFCCLALTFSSACRIPYSAIR